MFFVVIVQNHKKIAKMALTIVNNYIRLLTKPIELVKIIIKNEVSFERNEFEK